MTKNTKAKNNKPLLTLIFTLNKKNTNLQDALDSIARQTDKNANLVFVFNDCNQIDINAFKKFNFEKFCKVDYVFVSENINETYIGEYVQKNNTNTKYFYYGNLDTNLTLDFVSTVNNFLLLNKDVDILSFHALPNIFFKDKYIYIKSLADIICNQSLVFLQNVVVSFDFITKQKLDIHLFQTYPAYYYLQLVSFKPTWILLSNQLCHISAKSIIQYNIMDLFDQCDKILDLENNSSYYKNSLIELEYVCIVTLLVNFIFAFIQNNKHNFILQKRILIKVINYLEQNIPNWYSNKWLSSKMNKNDKSYLNYVKYFKPKLRYVLRAFHSKLKILGYESKK